MNSYVGQFYWVTRHSLYCVTIRDLVTTPEIMKMSTWGGRELGVPVGAIFRGKFYVALTSEGMIRYSNFKHQRALDPDGPPKPLERLSRKRRGMRTGGPVGIFLNRDPADDCYAHHSENFFDSRWHNHTAQALNAIGSTHPLVTISREGSLAIPFDKFVLK